MQKRLLLTAGQKIKRYTLPLVGQGEEERDLVLFTVLDVTKPLSQAMVRLLCRGSPNA